MVFVVDDLGAWLVGLLADAGRKKLTELVFGPEQERALRKAATDAFQDTAAELHLSADQARRLAAVISKGFRKPVPDMPTTGPVTLLESLQAGIARQLATLDDAELTGAGPSSAGAGRMSGTVLADRLTDHLVREIISRGSSGGPLTPLADQLNHELTRQQGQRIEGMLSQLAADIRGPAAQPDRSHAVAGWPLNEVTDPFLLEVHRPIEPDEWQSRWPVLPAYVPRGHDTELGSVVQAAAGGRSGVALLVGGSSTGKTRACWEALELLRGREPAWRLWHPIDPSRPEAALRELLAVGPRTVVWLNEAQFYLDPPDGGLGERVAAGLRELLRDPARAPVLVLATLWPHYWDGLTARPAGGDDPHAQARELLAGHDITVPAAFSAAQLHELSRSGDARLAQAAAAAQDGQVIQFLAGAPELLARYRHAPPAATALVHAAMDARRLGMGVGLPQAFLEGAAPGYLTDTDWDALDQDWLEQALAYTAIPCKGVRGPLTRIRPRPAPPRPTQSPGIAPGPPEDGELLASGLAGRTDGPLFRLADYLDQHGRQQRKGQIPPASFWAAAAGHASLGDQAALGDAASDRGLYRAAAQLHKNAAAHGNRRSAAYISKTSPARWAATHLPLGDPLAVGRLLGILAKAGDREQIAALLGRDPAAHVNLDDLHGVAMLLFRLRDAGAREQITTLLHRDPAAHVPLDRSREVAQLLGGLQAAGSAGQVTALASRAATHVELDDPVDVSILLGRLGPEQATVLADRAAAYLPVTGSYGMVWLLEGMQAVGLQEQATALASRAATQLPLDEAYSVAGLLDVLRAVGAQEQITALLGRDPAAHANLDDMLSVASLLRALHAAGAQEQATALASRAATHVDLGDPYAVAGLLDGLHALREAGAPAPVDAMLHRDPAAHARLDDPYAVGRLLDGLRAAGEHQQITALLGRDPGAHVRLDDPRGIVGLLRALREAGAQEQITALLGRDPGAHVRLDDTLAVADLLSALREAGAQEQATTLAGRAVTRVPLDRQGAVAHMLRALREAGAQEQATTLVNRLPAAGLFRIFLEQQSRPDRFSFGREADGSPSEPWGWEDLD